MYKRDICFLQISSIGLPTNVSHHGHAGNMEEAQNLIEKLIRGESVDSSLPQPLQPNNSKFLDQLTDHVRYCDHFASVICKLLKFQYISHKSLVLLEPSFVEMLIW